MIRSKVNRGASGEPDGCYCSSHLKDRLLIDRVLNDDDDAKEEFVARYRKLIYSLLITGNLPVDEREDLFQQVFVHLWEQDYRRLRLWSGTERFAAWLSCIVKHLVADHWRNQARCNAIPCALADGNVESVEYLGMQRVYASHLTAVVGDALRRLSHSDKDLMIRRFYRGESYREMAAASQRTIGHLGVSLQRAEIRMRRLLIKEYPDFFSE